MVVRLVLAVRLVVVMRLRLEEGVVVVEVEGAAVVEGGENVTDLADCDLVKEEALVCRYPPKFTGEALAFRFEVEVEVEVEEEGTRRLGGMLVCEIYDENVADEWERV